MVLTFASVKHQEDKNSTFAQVSPTGECLALGYKTWLKCNVEIFRSPPNIWKWILRIAFVAAIVSVGLWVEHQFYASQANLNEESTSKTADKISILFMGGSQANGISTSIEKYLNPDHNNKKFEIRQWILPGFAVTGFVQYHDFITQKFAPDYIISLVGCLSSLGDLNGETQLASDISPQEVFGKIGIFALPSEELKRIPGSELYEAARKALIKLIELRDRQNMASFSFLNPQELIPADKLASFDHLILELGLKMVKEGIRTERDQRVFEHLLLLGQKTQRMMLHYARPLPANETNFFQRYHPSQGQIQDAEKEIFEPSNLFIDRGLALLNQEPCETFIQRQDLSLTYNRLWLCQIHQAVKGKSPAEKAQIINALFSSENRFYLGFPRELFPKMHVPDQTPQPYFQLSRAKLKRNFSPRFTEDPDNNKKIESIEKSFSKNMELFSQLTKANKQKIILLQAPNIHENTLAVTARELKIPVIESQGLLDEGIMKNGRQTYFLDYICGSGHLTPLGMDIFSNHIAQKFKEILEHNHE